MCPRPAISAPVGGSGCSPFCHGLGRSRRGRPTPPCSTLRSPWWSWIIASRRCDTGSRGLQAAARTRATCRRRRRRRLLAAPAQTLPSLPLGAAAGAASSGGEWRGCQQPDQGAGGEGQAGRSAPSSPPLLPRTGAAGLLFANSSGSVACICGAVGCIQHADWALPMSQPLRKASLHAHDHASMHAPSQPLAPPSTLAQCACSLSLPVLLCSACPFLLCLLCSCARTRTTG